MAWIVNVTTRVVASVVVRILGSTVTHHITRGQMRLVERVLEGTRVAWASLMLECMHEKLDKCCHGSGSFHFWSMLVTFFFKHIILLRPPRVIVEEIRRRFLHMW